MAEISIDNIAVSYGGNRVIESLSLEIADQSFFTLLGPSGCGKTTLLRTLAGFLPVDHGMIRFGDTDVTRIPAHKRDIGMVFQDYALFPDKTVFENVAYGLRARKREDADIRKAVPEYLERVGLTGLAQRRPADLSGGQRQRVALARALVIKPKVLLMDEPLSNLDAKLRVQVRETIADLQRAAGITTVFVTHDQEEALALSDQIGLMRQGRIAQKGTPQDIYGAPVSAYVADFVGAANVVAVVLSGRIGAGERTTFRLGHVDIQAVAATDLDAGAAHVLMRPEDISVSATARPGSHQGVVVRRQYLGSRTHYRIRLGDDGHVLAVDCAGPDHAQFLSGDAVHVWLDPDLTRVVAA